MQHEVSTAYECGWSKLENGELLDAAEQERFEVFVTTDKNLRHQQNLDARRIAIVVLTSPSWPRIQHEIAAMIRAVDDASPGSYPEVQIFGSAILICRPDGMKWNRGKDTVLRHAGTHATSPARRFLARPDGAPC